MPATGCEGVVLVGVALYGAYKGKVGGSEGWKGEEEKVRKDQKAEAGRRESRRQARKETESPSESRIVALHLVRGVVALHLVRGVVALHLVRASNFPASSRPCCHSTCLLSGQS